MTLGDRLRRLAPSTFVVLAVALVAAASAAALVVVYRTGERIILDRERAEAIAERDLLAELDQEQGLANLVSSVARRSSGVSMLWMLAAAMPTPAAAQKSGVASGGARSRANNASEPSVYTSQLLTGTLIVIDVG